MTNDEAEAVRREFSLMLAAAEQLLLGCDERTWLAVVTESRRLIDERDFRGVEMIRASLLGGMGSFNDLVIHPMNGHRVADGQLADVNDRLQSLRERLSELARSLSHHQLANQQDSSG